MDTLQADITTTDSKSSCNTVDSSIKVTVSKSSDVSTNESDKDRLARSLSPKNNKSFSKNSHTSSTPTNNSLSISTSQNTDTKKSTNSKPLLNALSISPAKNLSNFNFKPKNSNSKKAISVESNSGTDNSFGIPSNEVQLPTGLTGIGVPSIGIGLDPVVKPEPLDITISDISDKAFQQNVIENSKRIEAAVEAAHDKKILNHDVCIETSSSSKKSSTSVGDSPGIMSNLPTLLADQKTRESVSKNKKESQDKITNDLNLKNNINKTGGKRSASAVNLRLNEPSKDNLTADLFLEASKIPPKKPKTSIATTISQLPLLQHGSKLLGSDLVKNEILTGSEKYASQENVTIKDLKHKNLKKTKGKETVELLPVTGTGNMNIMSVPLKPVTQRRNVFKCSICPFTSFYPGNLRSFLLKKDPRKSAFLLE